MLNESTATQNTSPHIRCFFYGTLRVGFPNHDRYCRGAVEITPATVLGRLYDLGSFPALEVPDDTILAHGTADPAADVATQARFEAEVAQYSELQTNPHTRPSWALVHGELMTFDDHQERLPRLDRLEGYCPGNQGLYQRVLVLVTVVDATAPAWVYVADEELRRSFKQKIHCWPR
jgi:gamma-glutamylcyclotransferase (GGCT)/AIG2-like uncharacterized protein YtfP